MNDITKLDMPPPKVWVQFGRKVLAETDKDIIILGEKLTDRHMNFAQSLIKKKFEQLSGLHSTLSVSQMSVPVLSGNVVQILRTGGELVSNINCPVGQVNLYNSLYTAVSPETKILVERCLGMPLSH